jgi:hypothetical protein
MKKILLSLIAITLIFSTAASNAMAKEHNYHNGNNYYHHTSYHKTYQKDGGTYTINKSTTEARCHKDKTTKSSGSFLNFHIGVPGHSDLRGYQSSFGPPSFHGDSNGSFGPHSPIGEI